MEKSNPLGMNRTGIDTSPLQTKEMRSGMERYKPSGGAGNNLEQFRRMYLRESERIGSVPLPGTAKGMLKTMMEKFAGHQPATLVNKLGERLAYERSGVRAYQAMIVKCEEASHHADGDSFMPPLDRVKKFCEEEGQHFQLLVDCMKKLGADPTAQTPDADVSAVAASGIMKVLQDPRTTVTQCLEAVLALELIDNAAWELLIGLAEDMGQADMVAQFKQALAQEDIHAQEVQAWYEQSIRQRGVTH